MHFDVLVNRSNKTQIWAVGSIEVRGIQVTPIWMRKSIIRKLTKLQSNWFVNLSNKTIIVKFFCLVQSVISIFASQEQYKLVGLGVKATEFHIFSQNPLNPSIFNSN